MNGLFGSNTDAEQVKETYNRCKQSSEVNTPQVMKLRDAFSAKVAASEQKDPTQVDGYNLIDEFDANDPLFLSHYKGKKLTVDQATPVAANTVVSAAANKIRSNGGNATVGSLSGIDFADILKKRGVTATSECIGVMNEVRDDFIGQNPDETIIERLPLVADFDR